MSDTSQPDSNKSDPEAAYRKIFIGGLSYSTDEEKLRRYFKQYGAVQDAAVMKDPISKRSRGFGFITFTDLSSVDHALAHDPHTIDSRKVEAKRAVPRTDLPSSSSDGTIAAPHSGYRASSHHHAASSASRSSAYNNSNSSFHTDNNKQHVEVKVHVDEYAYNKIFVGGLHYDTRDAEFRSYFERYGRVVSSEVMFNRETHKSRGFGFVVFEQEYSAVKVCATDEHCIDGKVIEVKRAIPRSKLPAGTPSSSIVTTNTPSSAVTGSTKTPTASSSSSSSSTFVASTTIAGSASHRSTIPSTSRTAAVSYGPTSSSNGPVPSMTKKHASRSGNSASASISPPVLRNVMAVTSYAAALKLGTNSSSSSIDGHGDPSQQPVVVHSPSSNQSSTGLSSNSCTVLGNIVGHNNNNNNNNSSSMSNMMSSGSSTVSLPSMNNPLQQQSLLYGSKVPSSLDLNHRPYRSNSEPVVSFENSAILKDDLLGSDRLFNRTVFTGATINKTSSSIISSTASSRSSSFTGNLLSPSVGGDPPMYPEDPLQSLIDSSSNKHKQHSSAASSSAIGSPSAQSSTSLGSLPWLSSPAKTEHSLEESMNAPLGLQQLPPPLSAVQSNIVTTSAFAEDTTTSNDEESQLASPNYSSSNNATVASQQVSTNTAQPPPPSHPISTFMPPPGPPMWFPHAPPGMHHPMSPQAFEHAAMQHHFAFANGMMYGNPPMQYFPIPPHMHQQQHQQQQQPPPDMWAAMIAQQQQQHQQLGNMQHNDPSGPMQQQHMSGPPGYPLMPPPHFVMPPPHFQPYFPDSAQQQMHQQFMHQGHMGGPMMYYPQQQQHLHMSYHHQQQLHYQQQQGGGGGGPHPQPSLVQMNSSISISNKSYGADGGEVNHHSTTSVVNSTTSSFAPPQSAINHNPGQGQGHTGEAVEHHPPGQENSGESIEVKGQSTQGGPPVVKKVGEVTVTETDEMFQFSELNLNSPEYIPARR